MVSGGMNSALQLQHGCEIPHPFDTAVFPEKIQNISQIRAMTTP